MLPPQVSGLVAMAMPQQKEACVWGPVPGRRGGQGKKREGALRAPHTLDLSLAQQERGREEVRDKKQAWIVCWQSFRFSLYTQDVA